MTQKLRITEIFYSLQGESDRVGLPTLFIRLTGCPLRCQYCDTAYAFSGGVWHDFDKILQIANSYNAQYICVTGGEPLAQANCLALIKLLCDKSFRVSIETSGALDIKDIDNRAMVVMDIKTPASGEHSKNLWQNIEYLKPQDQVKLVICNESDYLWAKEVYKKYSHKKLQFLFSPSHEELPGSMLAQWILQDRLNVRFQMQLHKYLWPGESGC